jgi:O-antigen/teichoic acid export membrane protein
VLQRLVFSISVTLFDLILLFPITIGSLFFPRITEIESELDKWELTRKVLIYVFLCMSIFLISLFPFISLLINVLYGAKFTNSVSPLIFLLPGTLFMSLSMIIMNYLGSCGNPIIVVVTPLVSLLFIFVSAYFLKDGFNSITSAKDNSVSCVISLFIVLIYFFSKKLIIESISLK